MRARPRERAWELGDFGGEPRKWGTLEFCVEFVLGDSEFWVNICFLSEEKAKMVRVVATPSRELALTNCAYCSRSDLDTYGSMVDVNNTIVLNLRYPYFLHFTSLSPPSSRKKILGNGLKCLVLEGNPCKWISGFRWCSKENPWKWIKGFNAWKKIHGNELKGLMLERKSLEINFRV
jgi:hypothetical protein